MKRRILSIICALALCLTLLPATALAVEGYDFTLSEESLDFGTVSLASNPSKTVTITNSGTENIIVQLKTYNNPNTYFVLNGNPEEYEVKQDWSEGGIGYYEATVLPGDSVNVDVQVNYTKLTDTESMDYDGTITFPVYEDDGSTLIEKNITATFNWVTAEQAMEVSETALNLGTVGQGYGDTQPVTFTITNTGQMKLDVVHCDLSFDDDQDADEKYYVTSYFKLTPNIFIPEISGSEFVFLSLEAGESETIGVYVKQGVPQGTYRATLVVDGYNYIDETYVYAYIPLTFTVGAAQYSISADPATLDFGTAGLSNTQAEAQTVTITNTGNTVDTITLPSADNFEITAGDGFSGSTATISQGRTASFTVQPKAGLSEGNYNTAITVTSTHSASTTVNLQFKVERKDYDLMADVSQLDFGYAQEGYGQPEGKTVTLTNVGKNALTVSLPTAEGYVVEGGYGFTGGTATIEPDATASFTVRPATGLEQGSHPATLTITGSAGSETASWPVALSFSVEPKVYAASVSPETVTFNDLRVGYEQPEAQTVTVTNTGNQALSLKLPSLEDYEIQAATGFDEEGVASLAVNGKASFTVRPAAGLAQGDHSDTLTLKLTSDDPDKSVTKDVALNCNIDETALEANPASCDFGTAQGSNYQVAERLTVTISVKSGVNGEYKIKIPANDPVFIFEPRDNFVLDEDGQSYTGTVKRVNDNVTQIAAFYLSVRNDLSPGNYDQELDLGSGLTLPLKFTVEVLPYEITVSPQQLDFGTIVSGVDETPAAQTLTVTNTGSNDITVNLPSSTNYVVTGGEGFEDGKAALESGDAASFTVRPKEGLTAEDYEEFLRITTDQSDVSKEILLSFAVEDPDYTINCDQDSLNFSAITVDETPPEAQTVTITNEGNVTNTVSLPQSDAFDLNGGAGFEGSTAVLAPEGTTTFTVRPKAGLSADDYSGTLTLSGSGDSQVSLGVSYVVEKGQAAVTDVPQAKTLTYTGEAQPLVTKGAATGGTLVYSLDQDGAYTTAIPTATNAGEYSVYYKVQGDKDHNDTEPVEVTVTIAKADPEVTAPVPVTGLTYTGEEYELITAGTTTGGTLVYSLTGDEDDYSTAIPTGTAAQSYTVWYKVQGNENYNGTEAASVTAVIGNALAEVTEAPEANTLTYTGQAQALVTAGKATGGDMMYRLGDSGEFSADIPTGTNAGDYSVWYKVVGDENHSDTQPVEVKVTIAKATPTYTVPADLAATYGDTLGDVTLPEGWAWDAPNTSVGNVGDNTFAAIFTPSDTVNYNTVTENLMVTVSAKNITGADITLGDALTYTGQEQTQQIASVTVDGLTVTTYEISGNTGTDADTYTLTVTGTGNFTCTATKEWTIAKANYDGITGVSGTVLANWPDKVTLPTIPAGASYGAASTTDDLTGLSIEGSVLSYTGGESIAEGQEYEITVPVNGGQNYVDYEITVTLTGTDKQVLTITGVTAQGGTYNGQPYQGYTGTPSAEGFTGEFVVTYKTTDRAAPVDAGTYTVTIAIPEDNAQYVGSMDLQFTIAPKPLTVSAPSASVHVGDSAPELALTYTGLVDGDSVTPSDTPTFTITKSDNTEITLADAVKTAGTYTITWSNEGITTFPNGTNYDITKNPAGTLKVSNRPVTPAPTPSGPSTGGSDGWTEIEDEVDETPSGSTVTVDMNGTTEVPAEVFEAVAGKDVTLELDMGGGVKWEINGQDIPTDLDFTDLDLGVSLNTSDIPVDVINMVTGEKSTVQLSLAHDGEFGFTLTLTAPVGTENKGLWANLYHYNTTKKQMLFETSAQVDSSGNVALKFTHASEYAIVLDESSHELPFTDTAKGAWYQGAVEYVYRNGIMTGTSATTFSPNTAMNRAMVAQILYNLEGQPTVTGESTFTDSNTHWAAKAIAWAQKTGVVSGYGNNTFRPNQAVTREELAQMLYNYAEYKQYDLTASGDLIAFPDGNNVQGWAKTAMSWANGNQLINGFEDDTLRPGGDSTRAQAASILMNFDVNLVEE